jgi:hypothetical protein
MRESIKLIITNSLSTFVYYLGFEKNMLPAQIFAWIFLALPIIVALAIVYSNKIYELAMKSLSDLPFKMKLLMYPFIAANIYFTHGVNTAIGITYLILVGFYESLYIISSLSKNAQTRP